MNIKINDVLLVILIIFVLGVGTTVLITSLPSPILTAVVGPILMIFIVTLILILVDDEHRDEDEKKAKEILEKRKESGDVWG